MRLSPYWSAQAYVQLLQKLSFAMVIVLFSPTLGAAERPSITFDQLRNVFESEDIDRIVRSLNQVKTQYNTRLLSFLQDLWLGRSEKHPTVYWDSVSESAVRVEIANVLLQASERRRLDVPRSELARFVRSKVDSPDIDVATTAILTLKILDEDVDVQILEKIALRSDGPELNDPARFRASVISLATMCNAASDAALMRVAQKVQEQDHLDFIKETREKVSAFKADFCPVR